MEDIIITPLGADKVFIRSSSEVSVTTILNDAKEFFAHLFTNIVRWEKNVVPFQRGAWLRLYGIPLHAWNESFFKLCLLDVGRFMRADSCTVEKERFDYARILVATSSVEIINCSEKLLIDGVMVTMKVLEEWGFNIGDDACLFDEDGNGPNEEHDDLEEVRSDHDQAGNADFLVDKIVKEFVEAEGNASFHDGVVDLLVPESVSDKVERQPVLSEPIMGQPVDSSEPVAVRLGVRAVEIFLRVLVLALVLIRRMWV